MSDHPCLVVPVLGWGGAWWGSSAIRVTNTTKYSSLYFFNTSITSKVNVAWHQMQHTGSKCRRPHPLCWHLNLYPPRMIILQEDSDSALTCIYPCRSPFWRGLTAVRFSPVGASAVEVHADVKGWGWGCRVPYFPGGRPRLRSKQHPFLSR